LILLPDPVNLRGAFQMGIATPLTRTSFQTLDVLHVVGEVVPSDLPLQPFLLYQNIYPSAYKPSAGLILPASAFSEEEGTFIDQSGRIRSTHEAVPALGRALPSWQILCRIAQKLGVPGFDYESAAQIQAEMETIDFSSSELIPGFIPPEGAAFPSFHIDDHSYMGFPLRAWVAGLRVLYPESALTMA
jgi:anaerobic selenocysteine-containing dehydrogenase